MNNKTLIIGIIIIAVLALAGWWIYNSMAAPNQAELTQNQDSNQNARGTVYISVTDAAADMENISAVDMTINGVALYSKTKGWVTVSEDPKTFKLLELKANKTSALFAKADVAADMYEQVRFQIGKVTVMESGKAKTAVVPAGEFTMDTIVRVEANANTAFELDIIADESIHKTAKGEIVFAPVVTVESRSNATVNVDGNNMVTAVNGTVDSNASAGMDASGEVKANFKLDAEADVNITNGVIEIK